MFYTFRDLLTTAEDYRKAIEILKNDDRDQSYSIRFLQHKLDILLGVWQFAKMHKGTLTGAHS